MLEVGFLNAHLLWMTTRPEMEVLYNMITTGGHKAMGLEGILAWLLAARQTWWCWMSRMYWKLFATTVHHVHVISHGRLVDTIKWQHWLNQGYSLWISSSAPEKKEEKEGGEVRSIDFETYENCSTRNQLWK
jgi:hypothetical protein